MLKFEEQVLLAELDRLPPRSRVAFAVCCAQRLAGVYHRFLAQVGQPDRAADCDGALEYVWSHILKPSDEGAAQQLLAEIVALIPDQDAPGWTPLTAYGDDALSALAYGVSCLRSRDAQDATWAARRVYEALDFYVTSSGEITPGDSAAEARVLSDAIVQKELERQARDIDELGRLGDALSQEFLDDLRQRSTREQAIAVD